MKCYLDNVITIQDPTPEVQKWVKKNLLFDNPEFMARERMGFSTWNIAPEFRMYEVRGNKYIVPYGCLRSLAPLIKGTAEQLFKPNETVDYGAEIELYDYQRKAVQSMYEQYYGILQAPAGSGKTQIGIALIAKLGKKALWLTHTKDLLTQSYDRAKRYIPENMLGTITEGKVNVGTGITFATVQTMVNLDLPTFKNEWDVIIVDECHRVSASANSMTMFQKVLNNLSAKHKYGLSATVHRSDGLIACTFALLGNIIYTISEEETKDKIMRVGIKPVDTDISLPDSCFGFDGKILYAKMLNWLAANHKRNEQIIADIEEEKAHSCLILSDRLEHLQTLMETLPDSMRGQAVFISGKSKAKERDAAMAEMRSGKKKYLFATYSLAKEGLDIPRLERLFLVTPQKDYAVVTQSIGRIARTFDGKADPICYDYIDNEPYLIKSFKKRCTSYRKNKCYWV